MPALEFKGKQHIYTHHLTVPLHMLTIEAIPVLRLPT